MKTTFTLLAAVLLTASVFAQSPEKMSYQAIIRNSNDALVTNTQIGMQISILQGTTDGTLVYTETQTPTTNANGLVSIEIGGEASFDAIDWANGPYFIKTETDPTGGEAYTITGTSQLLSVPYALCAKTAESFTGTITETDPVFTAWDKSTGISITESQVSDLGSYLETETDPAVSANFDFSDAANSDLLQFNGTKWVKVTPDYISDYTVTESDVTTHQDALNITESQISDLQSYLTNETDPAITANFNFTGAANGDLLQFNGTKWVKVTPDYISDYTVTESDVTTHQDALNITESQISDLGNYIETETDPSIPTGTTLGEMQYWDGTAWVIVNKGNEGQMLGFIDGIPTWVTTVGLTIYGPTDVYNPITGKVWMDRNLGASQVATSSTDADAYGDLYQWGRGTDGHEKRTSGTTSTLSSSDDPGHGDFIKTSSSPYDWRSPQNNNLWQGVSSTNNPCPVGYRLPTETEWEAERASWSSNNSAGAFASPLKLPVAGYRHYISGLLYATDSDGYYWTSTVDGINPRSLYFSSSNAYILSNHGAVGNTIRCIKD